jgi:predicted RNA-binding protein YlqC (UPF0109 family)
MTPQALADLVEYTAKLLITTPEAQNQIKALILPSEGTTITVELQVPEIERGKVIGRQGRTAEAIRVILNAAANHQNKRAFLLIAENQRERW